MEVLEHPVRELVVFAIERASALWTEIGPLLQAHFDEIAHDRTLKLEPYHLAYMQFEAAGSLRCYTARVEGKLVGYLVVVIAPHMHYVSLLQATQDVIYVDPEHRKSGTGLGLLRFAERHLEQDGVDVISQHVKIAHPTLGKVLEHMGYEPVDTIYVKRIRHGMGSGD
jgi:GNAT superfamily N-acetyltransferase